MKQILFLWAALACPLLLSAQNIYDNARDAEKAIKVHVNTDKEPLIKGKYQLSGELVRLPVPRVVP